MARSFTLAELADYLQARVIGPEDITILRLAELDKAGPGDICFISDRTFEPLLADCQASALIVAAGVGVTFPGSRLQVANPYLAFARLSQLFDNRPGMAPGIHSSAIVDPSAALDPSAAIGACVVIGAGVVIGADVEIGAGCVIGPGCSLGDGCRLAANVTLYQDVQLGQRVIIHSSSVIGGDGFGFALDQGRWHKIIQLGTVRIGDDVEIGSCTSVDRGALGDTIIEEGVKIDNQVMVAHNVRIGRHTAIAACVGISGSTEIGAHCTVAGGVGFVGHIKIVDHVHVTGMTMVTKSIDEAGSYSSGTAMMPTALWKKNSVRMRQLDQMSRRLKQLEQEIQDLKSSNLRPE